MAGLRLIGCPHIVEQANQARVRLLRLWLVDWRFKSRWVVLSQRLGGNVAETAALCDNFASERLPHIAMRSTLALHLNSQVAVHSWHNSGLVCAQLACRQVRRCLPAWVRLLDAELLFLDEAQLSRVALLALLSRMVLAFVPECSLARGRGCQLGRNGLRHAPVRVFSIA